MRATFLAHFSGRGGSNALLRELAEYFRTLGHTVATVVGQDSADPLLTGYVVAGTRADLPWRQRVGQLQQVIEATRPDLVYSFSGRDEFDVLRFLSCVRVRHVFSLEQHDFADMRHWLRQAGEFPEAFTASTPDVLAAVGPFRRGLTAGWCAPYRVEAAFEEVPERGGGNLGDDRAPVSICFVGRLETEQKRVHWLPQIAAGCAVAGRKLDWHVYGDGPALPALRAAWPDAPVTFHGWCPVAALATALPRHEIFFLCSRWEGLPLAMVQGMFCGLACVVPDHPGGMPHVLADGGGWLYQARTPADAIAALLRATADRGELRRRGAVARATAARDFNAALTRQRWTELAAGLAALSSNGRRLELARARRFQSVPLARALWRRVLALARPAGARYGP